MITDRHYNITALTPYIDWGYFLHAWQMPTSLRTAWSIDDCVSCRKAWVDSQEERRKASAREVLRLVDDSKVMLRDISKSAKAKCRIGLFEANSQGDDILVKTDDGRICRIPCLRQQDVGEGKPSLCLSDYIRPLSSGIKDRIGVFATTISYICADKDEEDPYRRLLGQTLCDRLAEAAACRFHEEVRKDIWGYCSEEKLSIEELLREHNQGIRPAVGYPSLPDQSINFLLDSIIDMQGLGISLTENGAMRPHASVSGLMISFNKAKYFAVGPIDEEQFLDYAKRRGLPIKQVRQFLAANFREKNQPTQISVH